MIADRPGVSFDGSVIRIVQDDIRATIPLDYLGFNPVDAMEILTVDYVIRSTHLEYRSFMHHNDVV